MTKMVCKECGDEPKRTAMGWKMLTNGAVLCPQCKPEEEE